ncbi:MAG: hypothetical protein HQL78_13025 [Magnetococcales bacterium]|nr:hypothetical protein [Magnetococcales bacterium]
MMIANRKFYEDLFSYLNEYNINYQTIDFSGLMRSIHLHEKEQFSAKEIAQIIDSIAAFAKLDPFRLIDIISDFLAEMRRRNNFSCAVHYELLTLRFIIMIASRRPTTGMVIVNGVHTPFGLNFIKLDRFTIQARYDPSLRNILEASSREVFVRSASSNEDVKSYAELDGNDIILLRNIHYAPRLWPINDLRVEPHRHTPAQIVLYNRALIDCTLLDLSTQGANLLVQSNAILRNTFNARLDVHFTLEKEIINGYVESNRSVAIRVSSTIHGLQSYEDNHIMKLDFTEIPESTRRNIEEYMQFRRNQAWQPIGYA